MKPLPNGGIELTPSEAFAVKQVFLACGEDAYKLLNCQDAQPTGLDLAAQFEKMDAVVESLVSLGRGGATLPVWRLRSPIELVGTALEALKA